MLKIEKLILPLILFFLTFHLFAQAPEVEEVVAEEIEMDVYMEYTPLTEIPKRVRRKKHNGRYGFYGSGITVIPFIYNQLPKDFSDFMIAKKEKKYGAINKKNEELVPFIYDKIYELYMKRDPKIETNFVTAQSGKLRGIITRQGKVVVPLKYKVLHQWTADVFVAGPIDGKYGLISLEGETLHPFTLEEVPTSAIGDNELYEVKIDKKYGIYNKHGKVVSPVKYDYIRRSLYDSHLKASLNGKNGLLDKNGKVVLDFEYDDLREKPDHTWIATKDKKEGALDTDLSEMVPLKYDEVKRRNDHYFIVKNEFLHGIVDLKGKEVLPCVYRVLLLTDGHIFISHKKGDNTFFIIDKFGKPILQEEFAGPKALGRTNLFEIQNREGKKALFNASSQKIVTAFEYDGFFTKRKRGGKTEVRFRKEGSVGVISSSGEESN